MASRSAPVSAKTLDGAMDTLVLIAGALVAIAIFVLIPARVMSARRSATKKQAGIARCPCCGYKTMPAAASFEICPVCFWQDDGQGGDEADQVWGGPNCELSLSEAQRNFKELGASHPRHVKNVRPPSLDEL